MNDNFNFKTFLLIGSDKITISTYKLLEFQNVYKQEVTINKNLDNIDFEKLNFFLSNNIFEIERVINEFVKKIVVIVDIDQFFFTDLSIKKKFDQNFFDLKSLNYLLNEAKENCRETIDNRKIIHMIIKNYCIDNKNYNLFPKQKKFDNISLDIQFICLSNSLIKSLEEVLRNYQISLSKILCAEYIRKFLTDDRGDIFQMTHMIEEGHNSNEVKLVSKKRENKGFFEKFFNFFS